MKTAKRKTWLAETSRSDPARHRQLAAAGGSAPHRRRAHWTAGKRRNAIESWLDWSVAVRNLREIGRMRRTAELARLLGIDRSTIIRWRRGIDIPPAEAQMKLVKVFAQWKLPLF